MKKFWLVFEDLLNSAQKAVAGPFLAESEKALIARFELQKRKNPPQGYPHNYWDGKIAGEVVIYIVPDCESNIQTPDDLQRFAHQNQCSWY